MPWFGILLCGLPIIILGLVYKKFPPKKINHLYGYRTTRSMQNMEVWTYANKIGADAIIYVGVITSIFGIIPLFIEAEYAFIIPVAVLVVGLLLSIFYCEMQLNKKFDKNGNPLHK